jgi:GT2 family glycosyltransferase
MTHHVAVSVIVPSHRRLEPLRACLTSLLASDFPADRFEILVVDDGNEELLEATVAAEFDRARVTWLRQESNGGPAAARNAGARQARGAYLAFIDDDCLAAPDWLSALHRGLERSPGAAVGGALADVSGGSLFCAADQALLDVVYEYYNRNPADAKFLATANFAVPAAGFRAIGGFDERYRTSEDRDFCARWLASGRRLVFAGDARVAHAATSSTVRFWRRHYAFGRGAYRFRSQHTRDETSGIALEPPHFYRQLVAAAFRRGLRPSAFTVAALIACSQAASACGFFAASLADHTSKDRTA